jgi:two-component system phosphate regulon sensor histidine kinase PhoR
MGHDASLGIGAREASLTNLPAISESFLSGAEPNGFFKIKRLLRMDVGTDGSPSISYRDLFEQLVNKDDRGLLFVNSERRVLAMNPAACDMLQYTGPLPCHVADIVHDVNVGFAVGDALHDRRPVRYEAYTPTPDRLLRFHIVPILASTGQSILAIALIEDVTRLRHLETVRRDFVANVSHELRSPIASINLLVETLQNGGMEDPAAAAHFLERIQVETQSMARLVEELLELSRLESGRLSLSMEPTAICDVLERVMNRLEPAAREKAIDLRLDVPEALPAVMVDPERIEQVLMNLVHNAIKFTPTEGKVTLRAARQGRGVVVEVVDTGVGVDPAEVTRIFERFYKVDKGRNRAEGTGLGLAIARHLLELHGSQLRVVSEVGRGSRFFFALPIAD